MGQIQSVGDVLSMLRRRIVLILGVLLLGTVLTLVWVLDHAPLYEAMAVAEIESPAVTETTPTSGASPQNSVEHRLRILEQKLMARDNLLDMVARYQLYSGSDLSPGRKVARLRDRVHISQIVDHGSGWGATRVPTGMRIEVRDTVPETAAALANDFLKQLVALNDARRSAAAQQNLEFYKSEANRIEAQMAVLEERIAAFKEENAPYLPAGVTQQRAELSTLKATLLEIRQKLIELDAGRARQRAEVIERQSKLLREQEALIQKRIAEINAAIAAAPEVERQFGVLTRQLEQLKAQDTVITQRATDAEMGQLLTSENQFERIAVLEDALVPENPSSGSRKKKLALGMFLSGVLGVAIAFVLEVLNPVIRTPAQLEHHLNVKAVVAIPKLTTPKDRRRRRLIWLAILAGVLALVLAGAAALRDGVGALFEAISRRASGGGAL
jgi:uncharacterized protein involved in exopolysaccharide biosynthesis